MIGLAGAVFMASLLGSVHCAGMCGAFLAFAVSPPQTEDGPARARLHAAYNGGRLVTYCILGALSGLAGAALDIGAGRLGLERAALGVAGAIMIGFGVVALLRGAGVHVPRAPMPSGLRNLAVRGHRGAAGLPPVWRAWAVGLLTTLLPCGWLYAFVITAAGTGDPLRGAVVMAVFWAGTLPVMVGIGVGVQSLAGPLRRHIPLLTSLVLIGVGMYTVGVRLAIPASGATGVAPAAPLTGAERVRGLSHDELPCCTP